MTDHRRWMLWRDIRMDNSLGPWYVGDTYGETEDGYDEMLYDPHSHEQVEAMPVAEHERLMATPPSIVKMIMGWARAHPGELPEAFVPMLVNLEAAYSAPRGQEQP